MRSSKEDYSSGVDSYLPHWPSIETTCVQCLAFRGELCDLLDTKDCVISLS